MCLNTYVACGGCDVAASELTYRTVWYRTEVEVQSVDEDGDPCGDSDWEDNGDSSSDSSEYLCPYCGWSGTNLDQECVDPDCECEECVEPESDDTCTWPDRPILLYRVADEPYEIIDADVPDEIVRLLTDRTIVRIPVERQRAEEIYDEILSDPNCGYPVEFKPELHAQPWEITDLMLTTT